MLRPVRRLAIILAMACAAPLLLGATAGQRPTLESLQTLIGNGDFKTAVTRTDMFLKAHPGNRDARFLRAVALAGLGHNDKAIEAFKALARAWPNRPEPANNLAALYARRGEYRKARKWLKNALQTQEVYAIAHRNLGDIYTALATLAYSQVLESGNSGGNKGLHLALVEHMYYPDETGRPLPQQTSGTSIPKAGADASTRAQQQATAVKAPEPTPEPVYPPGDASQQQNGATDAAAPTREQGAPQTRDKVPDAPVDPEQTDTPQSAAEAAIVQTVHDWAEAWSRQDYDAYIGYYTRDFPDSGNTSRDAWLAERKTNITQKASIKVRIIAPEVTRVHTDSARVTFIQTYESPSYSDKVRKTLRMRHTEAGWRIARESSILLSRG